MLQYTYQSGLLYRLRSLGKVRDLHITIDGIQRWMFNDKDSIVLYILTPALTAVYIYQLYLSYGLFAIWVGFKFCEKITINNIKSYIVIKSKWAKKHWCIPDLFRHPIFS